MPDTKPTNPKDALGVKKVPLHCVPSAPLLEVGLAMMEGGRKYGTHNYRDMGVRMSTYYNAVFRHLIAWWEGEDIDPDSGVHHVVKAIACLFVLRDSMTMGNCEDDRPLRYANGLGMDKLNEIAAGLIEKYPECAKPFLENGCLPKGTVITTCGRCGGSGKLPSCTFNDECPNCKGIGTLTDCIVCRGSGLYAGQEGTICRSCEGRGKV